MKVLLLNLDARGRGLNMSKTATEDLNKNPMIGSTPGDTINNVVGALEWLNALDNHVNNAFGGEPIDSITFGRYLLGKCCIDALEATGHELNKGVVKEAA